MSIFFVGNTSSPFITQDVEIFGELGYVVTVFDISKYQLNLTHGYKYLMSSLLSRSSIASSQLVWIWFADIHAVPAILWAKLYGIPVAVCQGDYEVTNCPEMEYGNQRSFLRGALTRWVLRSATVCITPSPIYEIITKDLEPRANVMCIPCCVDTTVGNGPIPIKKDLVVTSTFSVGSFDRKNIRLFTALADIVPAEMRAMIGVSREEYIQGLKDAKVYCQLSSHESFGVSLVEAMSYGCIPVVSDRGSLPWVVGECGLVVPYNDLIKTMKAVKLALKATPIDQEIVRERARLFSKENRVLAIRKLVSSLGIGGW